MVANTAVKKPRGRPKGSGKPRILTQKEIQAEMSINREGKYTFTSQRCNCVFYSYIMGAAMFCKHKNPLSARKIDDLPEMK